MPVVELADVTKTYVSQVGVSNLSLASRNICSLGCFH